MSQVVILIAPDFEDLELSALTAELQEVGHHLTYAGLEAGVVTGQRGRRVEVSTTTQELRVRDFDGLLIPGGYAPTRLCLDRAAVELTREFLAAERPVGAIGYGPLLLAPASLDYEGRSRRLTSARRDELPATLVTRGAKWVDAPVVVDGTLVTARGADDLGPFTRAFLALLRGGGIDAPEPNVLRITARGEEMVVILARGKLNRAHYQGLVPQLEEQIARGGRLRALILLEDFRGWTPAALWEELEFDVRHHDDFDRVAIVGSSRLEEWGTRLSQPFFSGEVRFFTEPEPAREWIEQPAEVEANA